MDAYRRERRHGEINGTDAFDALLFRGGTPEPELVERDRDKVSLSKRCLDCPIYSLADERNLR